MRKDFQADPMLAPGVDVQRVDHVTYVDRGSFKVPEHLALAYDLGMASADQLCAIAELFVDADDLQGFLSGDTELLEQDSRTEEVATRLEALREIESS